MNKHSFEAFELLSKAEMFEIKAGDSKQIQKNTNQDSGCFMCEQSCLGCTNGCTACTYIVAI